LVDGILSWLYRGLVFGLLLGLVPMLFGCTIGLPALRRETWVGVLETVT
jgi:hypothetical protein